MNKIYKVIYSKVKRCYVVVSEIAKGNTKSASSKVNAGSTTTALASLVLATLLLVGGTSTVYADATFVKLDNVGGKDGGALTTGDVVTHNQNDYYTGVKAPSNLSGYDDNNRPFSVILGFNGDSKAANWNQYYWNYNANNKYWSWTNSLNTQFTPQVGRYTVILGYQAGTTGDYNTIIGSQAKAVATLGANNTYGTTGISKATALGHNATAIADAFGINAEFRKNHGTSIQDIEGGQQLAIGSNSVASGQATALGNDVYAVGIGSIAIGSDDNPAYYSDLITEYDKDTYFKSVYNIMNSNAGNQKYGFGNDATAKYSPTLAQGYGSIAIGTRSLAYDIGTTAVGALAFALKPGSTAIGAKSRAEGDKSISIGNRALTFADNTIAVGNEVQVVQQGGTGYGYKAYASGQNSIAIGTEVYANSKITNAENQYNVSSSSSSSSSITPSQETKNGVSGVVRQEYGKNNAIVIGKNSAAIGTDTIAFGKNTTAKEDNSIAIGSGAKTYGTNSLAIGIDAKVENKNVDNYKGDKSMAIGYGAEANLNNSIALGVGSRTDYTQAEIDAAPWSPKDAFLIPTSSSTGVISVGSTGKERRIVRVAAGASDTDAVNVGQLRAALEKVNVSINGLSTSAQTHYRSINNGDGSQAGAFEKRVNVRAAYDEYVKLDKQYITYLARKQYNNETFDQKVLDSIKEQLDKYKAIGTASGINFEEKASDLKMVEDTINTGVTKNYTDVLQEIETAYTTAENADLGNDYNKTTLDNEKASNNFDNSGAKGKDGIAYGFKASVSNNSDRGIAIGLQAEVKNNSDDAIAIGKTAVVDNSQNAMAIGLEAKATSSGQAVVLGKGRTVTGSGNSVAIGQEAATTSSEKSVGVGFQNVITNSGSGVAIGEQATLSNSGSGVAIGKTAKLTSAQNSVAIGLNAISNTSPYSIAIGDNAQNLENGATENGTLGDNQNMQNIAIGNVAKTNNSVAGIALGKGAKINYNGNNNHNPNPISNGIAIGTDTSVSGNNGIAIGGGTKAERGDKLVFVGNNITTRASNYSENNNSKSIAVGNDLLLRDSSKKVVFIGNDRDSQITGRVPNEGQSRVVDRSDYAIAIGTGNIVQGSGGTWNYIDRANNNASTTLNDSSAYSVTLGNHNTTTSAMYSVVLGNDNFVGKNNWYGGADNLKSYKNIVIGNSNNIEGTDHSIYIGNNITQKGQMPDYNYYNIAMGYKASPGGVESITMGKQASTQENYSIAIGSGAIANKQYNVVLGAGSVDGTTYNNGDAFGGTYSSTMNGVTKSYAGNNDIRVVSVGGGSGDAPLTRRIVNVTGGKNDTDAVNMAQLRSLATNQISFTTDGNTKATSTTTKVDLGDMTKTGVDTITGVATADQNRLQFGIKGAPANGAEVQSIETSANQKDILIKVKDLGITEGKLAADSVTTDKIKDLNVTEGKLANDAVTSAKIKNDTIQEEDLKSDLKNKINNKLDSSKAVFDIKGSDNTTGTVNLSGTKPTLTVTSSNTNILTTTVSGTTITLNPQVARSDSATNFQNDANKLATSAGVKTYVDNALQNVGGKLKYKVDSEPTTGTQTEILNFTKTANQPITITDRTNGTVEFGLDMAAKVDNTQDNKDKLVTAGQVVQTVNDATGDLVNLGMVFSDGTTEAANNPTVKLGKKVTVKASGIDDADKLIDVTVAAGADNGADISLGINTTKLKNKIGGGTIDDAATNQNFVTGETVKNALAGKANADASGLTTDNKNAWAAALGTGNVATGDTNLVTGGTVKSAIDGLTLKYKAEDKGENTVKLTDGLNFKGTTGEITATAAADGVVTYALDSAVKNKLNLIDPTKGIANKDLDNLSTAGVSKIAGLVNGVAGTLTDDTNLATVLNTADANGKLITVSVSKNAVKDAAIEGVKVELAQNSGLTLSTNNDSATTHEKTYTLGLDFATAIDKNDNANKPVSAGQLTDALAGKVNKTDLNNTLNGYTKLDGTNLGTIDKGKWAEALGNGTIGGNTDNNLVTGATVKTELDKKVNTADKKSLNGSSSITVTNGAKILDVDATISITQGGVGTQELAANAVTTEKILNNNVTKEKLSNDVQSTLDSVANKLDTSKAKFNIKGDAATTKEIALGDTAPTVEVNGDGTTIDVVLENDKLKVKAKTGAVADNAATLVTGGNVKSYVDNELNSYAKLDGSNLTATGGTGGLNVTNWANALGTGTVADNDENLVKGKTVKSYIDGLKIQYKAEGENKNSVKLTDGLNFKGTANQITATVGANGDVTYALDNAVTEKLNLINKDIGIADKDLSNVSPAGKTVIQNIAQDSVKIEDGKNTTVNSTIDHKLNVTYTVDVNSNLEDITSITNDNGINPDATVVNITNDGLTLNDKKISGLKEAELSSTSTEAVTGKQLVSKASELANALGGGAGVSDTDGTFTQPSYKLKTKADGNIGDKIGSAGDGGTGETYNNVGAALSAVDSGLAKLNDALTTTKTQGLNFAGDIATTTQTAQLSKKVQITGGTTDTDRVITSSVASDNADGVIVTLGIDTGKLTTKLGTGTIDDKATKSNLVTGATVKEYVDNAINNVTGTSGLGNKADKDAGNLVTTPAGGGAKTSALDDTAKQNWATALGNGTIGNGDTSTGGKTTDNNLVTGKVVNDAIEAAKTAMIDKGFNVAGSAGGDGINTKLGAKVQIKGKDQNIAKASATAENVALITAEATSDSANGSVVSLSLNTDKLGKALVNNTEAAQSLKDNLTLGYKVNGNNAQTTSLTTGLDFLAGTGNNISDSTGVITNSGSAKAGITILNGKDGKVIIGLSEATENTLKQVTTNKDSINNITNEINTLREGSASPMVYTTEDGTKVTKINNKFYKIADVQGKRYDATSGKFYDNSQFTPDGKLKENPTELPQQPAELTSPKVVISAVNPNSTTPTTDAMKLNNVSGLTNGKTSVDFTSDTTGKNTSLKVTNVYQDPQGADQKSEIEIGNKGKITGVNSGMGTVAELISAVDTTKDGKETLGTVATLKDVQTIAKAGINFKDGQANTVNNNTINAQLGNTVIIKGKDDTTYNGTNYSAENLVTHVDQTAKTITIAMLKTPKFDALNLGDVKLTPSTDGGKLTLSNTKQGATDTKVVLDGLKEGTTRDAAATKGSVEDVTTDLNKVKNALGLNGADGTNGQTSTGPAGKDGLDGKSILDKVQAGRDGLSGSMVYTDKDGNRIDKVGDKYYKDSDVKDALTTANVKLADDGKYYPSNEVDSNGKHTGQTAGKSLQDVLNDQGKKEVPKNKMQISAVNPDGTATNPTAMGNVASGLGLDNVKGATSTAITEAKAKEAVAGTNGLLTKSGNDLNKVATVGDLQALAQAGIDFTDGQQTAVTVHRQLGTALKIQGNNNTNYDNTKYSAENLVTKADSTNNTITISMLKTPKFDALNLGDVKLTPSTDGGKLTISNTKQGATDTKVVLDGLKEGTTRDAAATKGSVEDVTTDLNKVKDALGLNGVDGTNGQTSTGPAGKDGLDGKSILDKVQAGRDGLSGSMVYTDKDGNRIDKVGDKYYKDSDVKDALTTANVKLADDGKYYPSNEVDSNGKHTGQTAGKSLQDVLNDQGKEEVPTTNMQVSAVNPNGSTTTPTAIGNVASGLGLDNVKGTTSTAITEAKAKEAVAGTNGLLTKSGKDLNNVATVGDLQALAQAGLDITDGQPTAIKNNVAHLPLGTKLKIQGKADTTADNSYSSDNLATMVDSTNKTVTISMLKTPKFDGINLKDVSLTPSDNGSTLNLSNTKDPNATDKGVVITGIKDGETDDSAVSKKALDEVKNSITSVAQDAVKLEDGKNTTVNSTLDHNLNVTYTVDVNSNLEDIDSITNSDGSTTLDITDKGLTLNDKKITGLAEGTDTQDAVNFGQLDKVQKDVDKVKDALGLNGTDGTNGTTGSTGPAGKDGLNGSSIVDKVEAGRNGLTGTMVYTNEAGDRLSAVDGKYYKASDLQGKRYDPATKKFYAEDQFDANGTLKQNPTELAKQPAEVATDDIVISAVKPDGSTTDGSKLNNVASIKNGSTTAELGTDGLKVTVTGQDPIVIGKAGQITGLKSGMTSVDDLLAKNPNSDTDKPILGTAATLGDVQKLAQAGFKLAGDDSTSKATPETVQLTKKITVTGASQKIGTSATDKAQVITSAVTKDGTSGDVKVELTLDTTNLAKAILNGIDGTNGNNGATGGTGNTGGAGTGGGTGTGGDAGTPGAGGTGGNTGAGGTGTGTNGNNGQDGKSILEGGLNLGYKVNSGTQEKTTLAKGFDFIAGDGTEKENTDNSKIADSTTAKEGIKIVAGKDGKIIIGLDETTKKAIDTVAGTTNGIDGTTGPSGKDGQNGKTLAQKVQAGRDGLTGSMVYTDKNGNRLEKAGDNYYKAEEIAAAGLKQANDGKYYNSSDVEADGTPKDNASSVDVDQKMTEAGKKAVDPKDMQVSAVNPDGSTTTPTGIGNVSSGLGLPNVDKAYPTFITEKLAKEATTDLLTKHGSDLNKVATIGDLQAVAQAGIDFSDGQTTGDTGKVQTVHNPLGSRLVIQGKANTDYNAKTYSADNLVTLADTVNKTITISMLKTPKFDAVELDKVKLTPSADGSQLTISNTNGTAPDNKVVLDGLKEGTNKDSAATKGSVDEIKDALGLNGTNGTNGTGTQGSTGPAGKDGLDGKTIMEQIQAGRDGLSGNMVYTDKDGNRLDKVGDKYYKADDVKAAIDGEGLKLAKDGKYYPTANVDQDGNPTQGATGKYLAEVLTTANKEPVPTKDMQISAINPDGTAKTPTIIGNVADGVKDNDAVNVKQLNALKSSLTDTGLTFTNGTTEKTTKLGKKVTIKGGTGNSEYITSTINQDADGNTSFELGINTANLTTALGTGTIGSGDTNNGGKATDKNLVTGTTVNTAINNAKEELQNAIDKVQGQIGPQGATGIDGSNGTSGTDGQNGKTLGQKVQAGRDGLTGSMVYTDDNGNRLEKVGDDYFKASDIKDANLKQANDGKYYKANEVDASGNPLQNATAITDVKAELKKADKEPVATKDIRITAVNPDGSTTEPTKIGNVADGVNKNDAVNKGQLDALKSSIEDGTIVGKMSYKVNNNPANATKADFLNFVAGDGEKTTSEDAQKGIVIVDGGAGKVIIGLDKETREKINAIDQNIVEKGVADKDLSNISTNGETVVKNLAKEAVKVAAGDNVTVTPKEADGNITYTVSVNKDLKGITSITNGDDTTEGTKITLSNDGVSLNDKKITGLANGDVTKDSTDAINGSQLYNSNKEISLVLGAGFNQATGQIEEPAYKLKAKDGKAGEDTTTYNNVKDALNALDSVVANNYDKVTNTASTDPEKFAEDSELGKIITVESVKNFFDYRLEDYSKNVNSAFEKIGQTIQNVDLHASAGVASAMAASQIPQVQNSTDNNVVGIGFGAFRGQKAMAMGISGMNDRKTAIYKVALTYDSQRSVGVSAGLGFSFGKGRGKLDLDLNKNSQLGQKLQEQEQVINQLQSERITQDQQIEKLQEQNETLQKQNEDFAKRIEALEKYILNK